MLVHNPAEVDRFAPDLIELLRIMKGLSGIGEVRRFFAESRVNGSLCRRNRSSITVRVSATEPIYLDSKL
jgi:hypothetical protein